MFAQRKERLIRLAIENTDQNDINEIACQFYSALINKQENGNF